MFLQMQKQIKKGNFKSVYWDTRPLTVSAHKPHTASLYSPSLESLEGLMESALHSAGDLETHMGNVRETCKGVTGRNSPLDQNPRGVLLLNLFACPGLSVKKHHVQT